jgi:simple sugar transport system ATP-binding protein
MLGRELTRNFKLLIAEQPTRGLDISATQYIRQLILTQREKGCAILLISEDLDEIFLLSDRIAVMYRGEVKGVFPAEKADIETIGKLMIGA